MDFDAYEKAMRPFSMRTKQEAAQVLAVLIKNGLVNGYAAYVSELVKRGTRPTASTLYAVVNGKIKRTRKRTKEERIAWRKQLNDMHSGKIQFKL